MLYSMTMIDATTLARRIRVARGTEPGDLVLTGGRVANVFTGTVDRADIVVADGWIAGVGPFEWDAAQRIDLDGRTVIPGLIDAHMHVESTLLVPSQLATVLVPRGTSTIISDPHEIANVLGVAGVELLIEASRGLALDIFYMAPSCVPAMSWEHAGAVLDAGGIDHLLANPRVLGLAEVMNFPGVLAADPVVLGKLETALRRHAGGRHIKDVEGKSFADLDEQLDAGRPHDVGDLMRIRDDRACSPGNHDRRELRRDQQRALDVHVRIDQARDDRSTLEIDPLGCIPFERSNAGDPSVGNDDVRLENGSGEDVGHPTARKDQISRL